MSDLFSLMSRSRDPAGVLTEQRDESLREVAGGNALEVEDRDQHFETLRPARIGRQNRGRKADALGAFTDAVAHPRTAYRHWTNASHDLALGQMTVAHQPRPTV